MDLQSDIDENELNALLFTDSDDEAAPPKSAATISRKGSSDANPAVTKPIATGFRRSNLGAAEPNKPVQGVSALDEDLLASVPGPKAVKPVRASKQRIPKKQSHRKETAVADPAPEKGSAMSSRDEALRLLVQEEEAEKSLHEQIVKSGRDITVAKPLPITEPPIADFLSDDDFLSDLDDKQSGTPARSSTLSTTPAHSDFVPSNVNVATDESIRRDSLPPTERRVSSSSSTGTEYVPTTTKSLQRSIPLSARAGRRARPPTTNKLEDSLATSTTYDPAGPSTAMDEYGEAGRRASSTESEARPSGPSDPEVAIRPPSVAQAPSMTSDCASAAAVQIANGSTTILPASSSLLWESVRPVKLEQGSVPPPYNVPIVSQIQGAAMANQIAQLQSDLSRSKRIIKELECEVEILKVQSKSAAADYQEHLLAQTKSANEREVQMRVEEERKVKAAIEHINVIQQAAIAAKERLHQEAIDSLKRMHEMEIAAVKRQHSDEHKIISMSEAVGRSAVTVEGVQREIREEIARANEQRRADTDAREKLLMDRERKLQEEIKRHANVIATFESLRREHDAERGRLYEEEVRLQTLQEFLMSESSSLRTQSANERCQLQEEKRTLERAVKDWKMEVAANQAEIAFLRDKAQAKVNEAQAAENAGQRAFVQAHQMVISEGEIVRRDREIAAKIRAEMEQEKQRIEQTSATLIEQQRQLSARMGEVQKLGERIRTQSEAVAKAYRQAQADISESKELKHDIEQEKLKMKSDRASTEELRAFVHDERKRMEADRLEVVRQRQKVILERRDPKLRNSLKPDDRNPARSNPSLSLNTALKNENRPPASESTTNSKTDNEKREITTLSAAQEKELFHLRMRVKMASEYARNEKKTVVLL